MYQVQSVRCKHVYFIYVAHSISLSVMSLLCVVHCANDGSEAKGEFPHAIFLLQSVQLEVWSIAFVFE